MIREIADFIADPSSHSMIASMRLASQSDDQTYLEVWRAFADGLSHDRLWQLAERLLMDDIHSEPPRVRDAAQMAVWAQAIRRGAGNVVTAARLLPVIEAALTRSIPLAADLYYFWASVDPRHDTLSSEDRDAVRSGIYRTALTILADPATLVRCLHQVNFDGPIWLSELIRPSDDLGQPASSHRELSDWRPLGPALTEAIRQAPEVAGPPLSRLVGKLHTNNFRKPRQTYELDVSSPVKQTLR